MRLEVGLVNQVEPVAGAEVVPGEEGSGRRRERVSWSPSSSSSVSPPHSLATPVTALPPKLDVPLRLRPCPLQIRAQRVLLEHPEQTKGQSETSKKQVSESNLPSPRQQRPREGQAEASCLQALEKRQKPQKCLFFPHRYAQTITLVIKNTFMQQGKHETERKTVKRARRVAKNVFSGIFWANFEFFWLFRPFPLSFALAFGPRTMTMNAKHRMQFKLRKREGVRARESCADEQERRQPLFLLTLLPHTQASRSLSLFHSLSLFLTPPPNQTQRSPLLSPLS